MSANPQSTMQGFCSTSITPYYSRTPQLSAYTPTQLLRALCDYPAPLSHLAGQASAPRPPLVAHSSASSVLRKGCSYSQCVIAELHEAQRCGRGLRAQQRQQGARTHTGGVCTVPGEFSTASDALCALLRVLAAACVHELDEESMSIEHERLGSQGCIDSWVGRLHRSVLGARRPGVRAIVQRDRCNALARALQRSFAQCARCRQQAQECS